MEQLLDRLILSSQRLLLRRDPHLQLSDGLLKQRPLPARLLVPATRPLAAQVRLLLQVHILRRLLFEALHQRLVLALQDLVLLEQQRVLGRLLLPLAAFPLQLRTPELLDRLHAGRELALRRVQLAAQVVALFLHVHEPDLQVLDEVELGVGRLLAAQVAAGGAVAERLERGGAQVPLEALCGEGGGGEGAR